MICVPREKLFRGIGHTDAHAIGHGPVGDGTQYRQCIDDRLSYTHRARAGCTSVCQKSVVEENYFACPEDSFGVANRFHFTASTPSFAIRKAHAGLHSGLFIVEPFQGWVV